MTWSPRLTRTPRHAELESITLGLPIVDEYLQFVGARCRPNTWLATAYDLLVFFSVIRKFPANVTTTDVFAFLEAQRSPRADGRVASPGALREQMTAWDLVGIAQEPVFGH